MMIRNLYVKLGMKYEKQKEAHSMNTLKTLLLTQRKTRLKIKRKKLDRFNLS